MQDNSVQAAKISSSTPGRRGAGRPRALTLEDILDAAIEIGLAGLSMPALAAKLGTGTGTLYNYVANRNELIRLAAQRKAGRPVLDDLGQDWRGLVRSYAVSFRDFWMTEPQLFEQYMHGTLDPDLLLDYTEALLAAMARRGFDAEVAYRIFAAVNLLVLGAIVRSRYVEGMAGRGTSPARTLRLALAGRCEDELPHMRGCISHDVTDKAYDFEDALERMIGGFDPDR